MGRWILALCLACTVQAEIAVVCVGDSNTVGKRAASGHDYPAQLSRLLGSGYSVYAKGVGGRTMHSKADEPYEDEEEYDDAREIVEDADVVLLIGSDPRVEAPVLNARLRRANVAGGTHVASIGPHGDLTYPVEKLGESASAVEALAEAKKLAEDAARRGVPGPRVVASTVTTLPKPKVLESDPSLVNPARAPNLLDTAGAPRSVVLVDGASRLIRFELDTWTEGLLDAAAGETGWLALTVSILESQRGFPDDALLEGGWLQAAPCSARSPVTLAQRDEEAGRTPLLLAARKALALADGAAVAERLQLVLSNLDNE